MTFAALLAALAALKGWVSAIAAALGFARQVTETVQSESDKAAGRAEANADTLRQQAERVTEANTAEIEAQKQHAAQPDSDDAFDRAFQRKD